MSLTEHFCAGEAGANGENGAKGATGEPGRQGETGATGENGDAGPQGDQGETGAKGVEGVEGPVGETGATGEKGEQGAKGETGEAGEKGDAVSLFVFDVDRFSKHTVVTNVNVLHHTSSSINIRYCRVTTDLKEQRVPMESSEMTEPSWLLWIQRLAATPKNSLYGLTLSVKF